MLHISDRSLFFHLQYNPADPPARTIQRWWRDRVLDPFNPRLGRSVGQPLANFKVNGQPIRLQRLTIAYSRNRNLGQELSYRRLRSDDPSMSVSNTEHAAPIAECSRPFPLATLVPTNLDPPEYRRPTTLMDRWLRPPPP